MSDLTLNVSKTINAPIEKVFDAWLDPKMLAQFILPMPGMPQPKVTNQPVQGGRFSIVMRVGDNAIAHSGEYLQVNRPNSLIFSWISPYSIDGSTVTIAFTKADEDRTNVELTYVRFIDEQARSDHEEGWTNILDALNEMMQQSMLA